MSNRPYREPRGQGTVCGCVLRPEHAQTLRSLAATRDQTISSVMRDLLVPVLEQHAEHELPSAA